MWKPRGMLKQDTLCTCNLTWRVRATIVAVETTMHCVYC
jgi:hypothetical protein